MSARLEPLRRAAVPTDGAGMPRAPLRRAAVRFRAAVQRDLAAARIGVPAKDYFALYPRLRPAIARRALADVGDALAGRFPANGLSDQEALQEARLWHAAWAQPVSAAGNRRAETFRLAAARLRARGTARLRERQRPMPLAGE